MELKLNTYKRENGKKVIDKTFISNTLDLRFKTVEDFINTIDLANINFNGKTNEELTTMLFSLIVNSLSAVKPLILDVFDDISEDDIGNAKTSDVVNLVINIVMFSVGEIFAGLTPKKK